MIHSTNYVFTELEDSILDNDYNDDLENLRSYTPVRCSIFLMECKRIVEITQINQYKLTQHVPNCQMVTVAIIDDEVRILRVWMCCDLISGYIAMKASL